jgi:hypothetical protein
VEATKQKEEKRKILSLHMYPEETIGDTLFDHIGNTEG